MATAYASIEIQDALLKLDIYLNSLSSKGSHERNEKIVLLATETFLKFMESEQFTKEAYDKVRGLVHNKHNYYALLLLDQMLKNNKSVFKLVKRQSETLFKGVWEKVWVSYDNSEKIENLKLIVRVWGHIFGEKYEQSLRKWIEQTYKTKLTVTPQHEAELKEIYGTHQTPKPDMKYQELISNMLIEQKPKKVLSKDKDESLLEALGIDQD